MGKVIILPTGKPGQELRSALLPKRRRRWNRRKAADNLRTVIGVSAIGLFFAYLMLSWMAGVPW